MYATVLASPGKNAMLPRGVRINSPSCAGAIDRDRARRRRAWGAEPATATVRTPSPAARPAWRRLRGPSPRGLQLADARDGIDVAMHQLAVALLAGDTANPEQLDLAARRS